MPLPPVEASTDARVAWAKDDAALQTANGRINAGRNCVTDLRGSYQTTPKAAKTKGKRHGP